MQGRRRALGLIVLLLLILIGGLVTAAVRLHKNSDALWQIVSEKCGPNQRKTGQPAPCQRVDNQHGMRC
nr:CDP-diacylglycerol pyrophosphatase [Candidatus Pantoea persica]